MNNENRIIVLVDMDCFYCQVEQKLNPDLTGQPVAVVQYNPWKGGGIIAVNYEARAMGVTRNMRGDEAKEKCPDIQLPSVPCLRGKADISKYRDAGKEVARVLQKFTDLLERASIDEAYLDITIPVQERIKNINADTISKDMLPNTFALGYDNVDEFISDVQSYGSSSIDFDYENAKHLLVGAVIVSEIRRAVFTETGYRCSAGIAHNKILAKLVCGMNKPNKQTVLPKHSINILYKTLPVKKVKHLGGKFGQVVCERLKISNMAELQEFSEKELQAKFDEKNGTWLYNISRGIDLEPVQARFNPKSIGCCKQLRGKSALNDLDSLKKWLRDLGDEIEDRLDKDALENNRTPKQMVVSFSTQLADGRNSSSSRSYNFNGGDELCGELFFEKALELVLDTVEVNRPVGEENKNLNAPITFLGISVGKFEDNSENKKSRKILDYFGASSSKDATVKDPKINTIKNDESNCKILGISKSTEGKEYILHKYFQITTEKKENTKENEKSEISQDRVSTYMKSGSGKENDEERAKESTCPNIEDKEGTRKSDNTGSSFFAKFLNKIKVESNEIEDTPDHSSKRATTPLCNIINCGDDSNGSDYSSSTINMEINKSLSLFEEDPKDIERVSNMRDILNPSKKVNIETEEVSEVVQSNSKHEENSLIRMEANSTVHDEIQNIACPECDKVIPLVNIAVHADYHLALKLRQEERNELRKEIEVKREQKLQMEISKKEEQNMKTEHQTFKSDLSITNFLIKIDDNVPIEKCSECGKKVPAQMFAEHLDFHEAQKLNRELNKKYPINHVTDSSLKRKRKSISSPVKKLKLPYKSIDSFFR